MIRSKDNKIVLQSRIVLFCLFGLLCTLMACDKNIGKTTYNKNDEVFTIVEVMPEFVGGSDALLQFFGSNMKYPDAAKKDEIQGVVVLEFIVEKDGSISNFKILRDIGGGCGAEAMRIAKQMPRWTPGMEADKPVRVSFKLPIRFKVDSEQP